MEVEEADVVEVLPDRPRTSGEVPRHVERIGADFAP